MINSGAVPVIDPMKPVGPLAPKVPRRPASSMTDRSAVDRAGTLPSVPTPRRHNLTGEDRANKFFDDFVHQTKSRALFVALETQLSLLFDATEVTVWIVMKDRKRLFSPRQSKCAKCSSGIPGAAMTSDTIICVEKGSEHESFDVTVDSDESLLAIPLKNEHDAVVVVAEVENSKRKFDASDVEMAQVFARKFQIYSHLLVKGEISPDDVPDNGPLNRVISEIAMRLNTRFKCRAIEFWALDPFRRRFLKYDVNTGEFEPFGTRAGVVGQALYNEMVSTIDDVTVAKGYDEEIDGSEPESVLMGTLNIKELPYAVILRANQGVVFGHPDEILLRQLIPLFSKMTTSEYMRDCAQDNAVLENSELAERLQALLSVAEIISGVLDIDILIPTIMERSCVLLNTERCSLFLIDQQKQELVSRFQGGLRKSLHLPLNRGIVGYTATTGNIVNIPDAYEDERFDKRVDLITGYRTKAILSVPIYNNRGEIAGVTEMINKRDEGMFDEDDVRMMMAFNVFCGISLDNARLYQASLDLTRQLRSFVEMSTALNKTMKIHDVLGEILTNARSVVGASRATVFLRNADEQLAPFCTIGDPLLYGTMFASEAVETRTAVSFSREEVFYRSQSGEVSVDGNVTLGAPSKLSSPDRLARVSSVLKDPFESSRSICPETGNICDIPMLKNQEEVIGVMEFSCPGKILPEDLKILDCFAVFATVSIERSELQEIAELGEIEVNLKQYMTDDERRITEIPEKLQIENETLRNAVYKIGFDVKAYDNIGRFKVLFQIANEFNLLETFSVPNEKWFRFITEISQTYKKVPYHNWYHAVDVTQFVTYQLKLAEFDNVLNKFELFGFIVAAICHDANHDGFTNAFNEKAETPLGILFKNQSVMETHHCAIAISVISKEESNIFAALSTTEYSNMWTLIIRLILITDMAKHFEFLKQVNALLDEGPIDTEVYDNRVTLMQLILKCADISNVSRPFELADRWCDVLCEEFFRQGDLEMAHGMEYTSPLNDREHLDKPKSQIGFYTFVCLPLFETGARAFPQLQVNVDQVKSNLAVWKATTAAREAEEAKIAASSKVEQQING